MLAHMPFARPGLVPLAGMLAMLPALAAGAQPPDPEPALGYQKDYRFTVDWFSHALRSDG